MCLGWPTGSEAREHNFGFLQEFGEGGRAALRQLVEKHPAHAVREAVLEIEIPGGGVLQLDYLVADFNGTLAVDGPLLSGVADALRKVASRLTIHVVTADTFGRAHEALAGLPAKLFILAPGEQAAGKRRHAEELGAQRCVAIGNGRNDRELLAVAALSIAVMQGEGAAPQTLMAADVVVPDIAVGLGLLMHPSRLVATLRR